MIDIIDTVDLKNIHNLSIELGFMWWEFLGC